MLKCGIKYEGTTAESPFGNICGNTSRIIVSAFSVSGSKDFNLQGQLFLYTFSFQVLQIFVFRLPFASHVEQPHCVCHPKRWGGGRSKFYWNATLGTSIVSCVNIPGLDLSPQMQGNSFALVLTSVDFGTSPLQIWRPPCTFTSTAPSHIIYRHQAPQETSCDFLMTGPIWCKSLSCSGLNLGCRRKLTHGGLPHI